LKGQNKMSQTEIIFYHNNGNIVTNKRVVFDGVTFVTSQIVSIKRTKTEETISQPINEENQKAAGCGCLIIIFLLIGICGLFNYTNILILVISILSMLLVIYFLYKLSQIKITLKSPTPIIITTYHINLGTSNTALIPQGYSTTDAADADAMEKALNNAILSQ
jgi:hypothetical protein